mmetsp:Transcript_7336/g.26713  ORF Transcript_7336/g.26713 Transcript_7336/m.26713 type:complete len:268 (+) Transcript_7336:1447-2250(+)
MEHGGEGANFSDARAQADGAQPQNVPLAGVHGARLRHHADASRAGRVHRRAHRMCHGSLPRHRRLRLDHAKDVAREVAGVSECALLRVRQHLRKAWGHEDRDGPRGIRLRRGRDAGGPARGARRRHRPQRCLGPPRPGGVRDLEHQAGMFARQVGAAQIGHAHRRCVRGRHRSQAAPLPIVRRHHEHGGPHDAERAAWRAAVWGGHLGAAAGLGADQVEREARDEGQGRGDGVFVGPGRPLRSRSGPALAAERRAGPIDGSEREECV